MCGTGMNLTARCLAWRVLGLVAYVGLFSAPGVMADDGSTDTLLAEVGEIQIRGADLERAWTARYPHRPAAEVSLEEWQSFLGVLVQESLEVLAAKKSGVFEDSEFTDTLNRAAVAVLIEREVDQKVTPFSEFTDAQVQEYLAAHREALVLPEERRASHVLFETREQAMAAREALAAKDLKAFQRFARAHSKDPETRQRSGELGYFTVEGIQGTLRDRRVEATIVEAVFALQHLGELTPVVQLGSRFSVAMLTGRRNTEPDDGALEARIRTQLWEEARNARYQAFIAELKKKYRPVTHPRRVE